MIVKNSIQPKRELKAKVKIAAILAFLKEEFKGVPTAELVEMKTNPELIKHVCQLVESNISKKYKPDKKKIVIDLIVKLIVDVSDKDKTLIANSIEFLHSNKDIKASSILRNIGNYIFQIVKKKVSV